MYENDNQPKNNLTALAIGFLLIITVTVLFFLKSNFINKKNEAISLDKTQSQLDDLKKYSSISATELLKKINNNEKIQIIDIRDSESFLRAHIIDSKNISLEALEENLPLFDKSKNYFIVDTLGLTSSEKEAMDILMKNGFKNLAFLEGGIYGWTSNLNPTIEFGDQNSLSDQSKVNYIKSDDFNRMLSEEAKSLYIIDLRSAQDFATGHIKNSVNIPLESLEERRKEIPSYKKIILYDDKGLLAFQGAVRLFDMGILNVSALSDGLDAWKQKSFEVVK